MSGGINWAGHRHGEDERGARPDPIEAAYPQAEPPAAPESAFVDDEMPSPPESTSLGLVPKLIAAALAAWILLLAWLLVIELRAGIDLVTLFKGVAIASGPIALLAVLFLIYQRSDRADAAYFADVAKLLRVESMGLTTALGLVSRRLAEERDSLAREVATLLAAGDTASGQIGTAAGGLANEVATLARQTRLLDGAASAAKVDMGVLMADLPEAETRAAALSRSIEIASRTAREASAEIDGRLEALATRVVRIEAEAGGAAEGLAAAVAHIAETSDAQRRLAEQNGAIVTAAIDEALVRASEAIEHTRETVAAQGAAMLSLVEQAQAALDRTGRDSARTIGERIADLTDRLDGFAAKLAEHTRNAGERIADIDRDVAGTEARLVQLDESGTARSRRLAESLEAVGTQAERMTATLESGAVSATQLVERGDALHATLAACLAELGERLPVALAGLEEQASHSHNAAKAALPEIAALEKGAAAAAARLTQGEEAIGRQREQLAALVVQIETRLGDARGEADALGASIAHADVQARALSDGAAGQLIEALVRVRETAQQAAERARTAIAEAIPASAAKLAETARASFAQVITGEVEAEAQRIAEITRRAGEGAAATAERLRTQLDQVARTAASLETRVEQVREAAEATNEDTLSRRSAMLIESLNSAAIDMSKLLSGEVSDTAWAAYLKGDRGVFTRRAVRLIDAGEAREIGRLYEEQPEFREQVNRYIHDFEALLRPVLAGRDGTSIGVALLSSDLGKLYVALAQAIERLRG